MKKNKKIAIVCNSINPDLVSYFKCKASISTLDIILFKNKAIKVESRNKSYVSSYMKKSFFDIFFLIDLLISFFLFFIVLHKRVGIIHFTTAHISNIFLAVLLKPFKVKKIFTIHDLSPHPGGKSFFICQYNKLVIHYLADEIISFSKSEIEKQKNKSKFKYFPLTGFQLKRKKPKSGKKTILFFGRMEPYKGFNSLYKIIKLSNFRQLNYHFIIAGKGVIPNKELLLAQDNVTIHNRFISDKELGELFNDTSFTLLPYDSATQSGVTILSYSYATPVIAYDVGALGEYIDEGKTGYCVSQEKNNKIINLLENHTDRDILELSNNIINEFQHKYSIQNCRNLYKDYYLGCINNC